MRVTSRPRYPQTSRRSSSLEKTRRGSVARRTTRSNSRPASGTGTPPHTHLPCTPVDDELARLEYLRRPGRRTAQDGADTGNELRVDLSLGDVVGAALERPHALHRVGARRGQDDDGHVPVPAAARLALAQPRTQLCLAREHDVGPHPLGDVERLTAPRCLDHLETVGAEVALEVARLVRVGICDEHCRRHGSEG